MDEEQTTKQKSNILPLATDTYYLPMRQDFIAICEKCEKDEKSHASAYCMALILAVMEKWTNEKISNKKDSLWVTMTYPQWVDEIYGAFKRSTIIDSLQVLVNSHLLQREAFRPAGGGKDQYRYLLNVELIKELFAATFENKLRQSTKSDHHSLKSDSAKSENRLRASSNSRSPKSEIRRFKEERTNHYIESDKERATADSDNPQNEELSIDQSPSPFSLEEMELLDWYKQLEPGYEPKVETAKESLPALLGHIHSFEDLQSLYELTEKQIRGNDKRVFLGNMKKCIHQWLKNRPAREPERVEQDLPALSEEEATELVLWTDDPRGGIALEGSIEDMVHAGVLKWVPRWIARQYDYDVPSQFHFTPEEEAEYDRVMSRLEIVAV
jgi:hypothetical protein